MKKINTEGNPFFVFSTYGTIKEGFQVGQQILINSITHQFSTIKRIQRIFDQGNGVVFIDFQ